MVNAEELSERVGMLSDYGQVEKNDHRIIGYNSRLDTLQAAILGVKIKYVEMWTVNRRAVAKKYDEALGHLPIKLPVEASGSESVYHLYVIQTKFSDECVAYLRDKGVMAQIHYPQSVQLQPCYSGLGYRRGDFPVSERLAAHGLSLPIFPEMTDQQVERVATTLENFHASKNLI